MLAVNCSQPRLKKFFFLKSDLLIIILWAEENVSDLGIICFDFLRTPCTLTYSSVLFRICAEDHSQGKARREKLFNTPTITGFIDQKEHLLWHPVEARQEVQHNQPIVFCTKWSWSKVPSREYIAVIWPGSGNMGITTFLSKVLQANAYVQSPLDLDDFCFFVPPGREEQT